MQRANLLKTPSNLFFKRFLQKSNKSKSVLTTSLSDFSEKLEDVASAKPYKDIPGPPSMPLLGNTWRFLPFLGPRDYRIENIDQMAVRLHRRYGKIVKIGDLLRRPDMLFLFDPDEIEKVFRREDTMPLRLPIASLSYYKQVLRQDFFGEIGGVLAVHGHNWQKFRSKVNQVMLQPRSAKMYCGVISATAQEFVDRIEEIRDDNLEMPEDFLNEIHKWSLESLGRIALDIRLGCLDRNPPEDSQRFIDAINAFFTSILILELKIPFWKFFSTPTFKKYIEALDCIIEICQKYINRSMDNLNLEENDNQLSVMQKVLKKENNVKLASILALDLFLVGVDTTSNALASILYQLSLHPEKQKLLHEEVDKILPDLNSELTVEKLEEMRYLKACIKETLRLYPTVIGNGRLTTSDSVIEGFHVPKGVMVIFQHSVISTQEMFFEKSNEFIPERWLKNCPMAKQSHPFASLPFGFGKRMCLGRRFADLELQTVLAKIIQNYRIEYHHRKLDYFVHPMYTPNGPLKLRFISKINRTE